MYWAIKRVQHASKILDDINLGQIGNDNKFNFKYKYDEDREIYDSSHSCNYYEMSEFNTKFKDKKNDFSIYSHNVRSLNGHWDNLLDILNTAPPIKFSVIALQEIWSVHKNYNIDGYEKFEYITRDKNSRPNPNCGGGVGFFIDSKFKEYEILEDESVFIPHVYESIWIKIKVKNGQDKIIGNVYRPNTAPLASLEQSIQIHTDIIERIKKNKKHNKCNIQIVSDFNVNLLNFETHGLTNDYINSLISKSFIPLITLPTRIKHQSATLIDHIWSNNICCHSNVGIIIDSLSDHFPVFYTENGQPEKIKLPDKLTRNINSKTIPAFCKLLKSTSWKNFVSENNPNHAFENFFEIINSARDISFPEIKVNQKIKELKSNLWMTTGLKVSQKRKSKLYAKKMRNPTIENINLFKNFNNIYNKLRRLSKQMYYDEQFKANCENSKQTWRFIREVIGSNKKKDQLPDFFKCNGEMITDCLEIANGFNNFYAQVGRNLASKIEAANLKFEDVLKDRIAPSFEFSKISEVDSLQIVRQMKPKISSGADFISNKLLKQIAPIIITPLHHLINFSLETGYVHRELKLAKVIPAFKDGDRQ